MKRPDVIIFDLDGTLLDNSEAVVDAYETSLIKYKLPLKSREYIASLAGLSTFETARLMGVEEDKRILIDQHFWSYFGDYSKNPETVPVVFPQVSELLEYFESKKIRMGVVTSNEAAIADRLLKKAGLRKYFEYIIGAEDVKKKKPSSEPLSLILSKMGITLDTQRDNSELYWMIGDTASDIGAAQNSGFLSIGIPVPHTYKSVIHSDADMLVSSIGDLLSHVRSEWG